MTKYSEIRGTIRPYPVLRSENPSGFSSFNEQFDRKLDHFPPRFNLVYMQPGLEVTLWVDRRDS